MSLAGTTDALVAEVLSENPRYPSGTVFMDADPASLPSILDAIREERVFVIVLPDRTEVECARTHWIRLHASGGGCGGLCFGGVLGPSQISSSTSMEMATRSRRLRASG